MIIFLRPNVKLIIEINDNLFFLSTIFNKTLYWHLFHMIQKHSLNFNLNEHRISILIKINGK